MGACVSLCTRTLHQHNQYKSEVVIKVQTLGALARNASLAPSPFFAGEENYVDFWLDSLYIIICLFVIAT